MVDGWTEGLGTDIDTADLCMHQIDNSQCQKTSFDRLLKRKRDSTSSKLHRISSCWGRTTFYVFGTTENHKISLKTTRQRRGEVHESEVGLLQVTPFQICLPVFGRETYFKQVGSWTRFCESL